MPAKKPNRPALVEYLLKLVWDEAEFAKLQKGGASAVASMTGARLTPKQRTAVLAAMKGDSAKLKVAVAKECAQTYTHGNKLWNSVPFIFGHPPFIQ